MGEPDDIRESVKTALLSARVIGLVGLSSKPERASYQVAQFMAEKGYRVIGVNPGLAGQVMFDEMVVARVSELPDETDMIDIFRRSDAVAPVVAEALAELPKLRVVWMQLGVENTPARKAAEGRGVIVIENRCPKIEYPKLFGDKRLADLGVFSF